jgi:AraC-like DNA-binding protein
VISAIPSASGAPRLARHAPAPALAAHVECYWTLEVDAANVPATVRALPDGRSDLVLDLLASPAQAHLGGAREQAATYVHDKPARLLGASLQPGAAFQLLGVAADALTADWRPLESLIGPSARALADRVAAAEGEPERLALLDTFLGARLRASVADPRVARAVKALESSGGALPVGELGKQAGASPRNLSRLFSQWVGVSPKRLARIVRAQAALRRVADGGADLAQLAADHGYADQAHLAREMRELFGAPPGELAEIFKRLSDPFNP